MNLVGVSQGRLAEVFAVLCLLVGLFMIIAGNRKDFRSSSDMLERLTAEVSLNFVAVVFLLIGAVLFIVAEWID
jgi:hypothetical protein